MKIFKFGGASVNSADAVKNVAAILKEYSTEPLLVVVSAMGKTTNALEKLLHEAIDGHSIENTFYELKKYHHQIIASLFPDVNEKIYNDIENVFDEMHKILSLQQKPYNFAYDRIVCMGEILSTKIVSAYLESIGINTVWTDARIVIKTDDTYRDGVVDWNKTATLINEKIKPLINNGKVVVTQGFIASDDNNNAVTLGREGSDYTAAIFAFCLDAKSMTIWKDVPGLLNADPKYFKNTVMINKLSYREAIELAYYGATIIHPKTIKPLQNKGISLFVKSFVNPKATGTEIAEIENFKLNIPCYIFKQNQRLISIYPKDFSFINTRNLSDIFKIFSNFGAKINLMQNSAISFSVCTNNDLMIIEDLIATLEKDYDVRYNENLELITIRHYNDKVLSEITDEREILLEQKNRTTAQFVLRGHQDLIK